MSSKYRYNKRPGRTTSYQLTQERVDQLDFMRVARRAATEMASAERQERYPVGLLVERPELFDEAKAYQEERIQYHIRRLLKDAQVKYPENLS